MNIEVLVDVKTELGEGPLWDVDEQRIYWIDSFGAKVFRCAPDGSEVRAWEVPEKIGSMALRKDGGAIVSLRTGLYALDFDSGDCAPIADPEADLPSTRLNDGKVDRQGRFLVGSMDMNEDDGLGALYRLDPDMSVTKLEGGIICSNGPCFTADGKTFYFTDTWSGQISVYDYDTATGTPSNKRCFTKVKDLGADVTGEYGAFDGATVDAEGCVWTALVYAGYLLRYAPDGTLDRRIDMPVKKVTSVMFGGPDLDELYVTSMAKPPLPRFPDDAGPRGSLFKITGLGIRGVPEARFAG